MAPQTDAEREPLLARNSSKDANGALQQRYGDGDESQSQQQGEDDTPVAEELSTAKLTLTLGATFMGVFFAAVDSTIIATLSAPISNSFNSFTLLSWLASAYLISLSVVQPLSGKLTDIYGRRNGLVYAHTLFAVGTLICGLARSEAVIITGRVIAGLGGGCINTVGTFVASDLVPLRRRGLWQGFGNLCFGAGASVGGVFGGWIADVADWRVAFLVQVPFIVVAGIVVWFLVDIPIKETNKSKIKRVDFLGSGTLVAGLVLLLVGLNSGGNIVPWTHPLVLSTVPLSLVLIALFIWIELKIAPEPVIDVRLLTDRTIGSGCLINWFQTMGYFSIMFYGPIFFQVRGFSAASAGVKLIPQAVGLVVGSLGGGWITRKTGRYYWLLVITQVLFITAPSIMIAIFNVGLPDWPPYITFLLSGTGYGAMITITLLALIAAVEHKHQAVITSASYMCRSTGSTIGIAIAGAVFQNVLNHRLMARIGGRDGAAEIIKRVRDSVEEVPRLSPEWKMDVLLAYMDAFRAVWVTALIMIVLGTICGLFIREHKLHSNLARR